MSENNNDQGSDSIYRTPTSETSVTSGDDLMAAYVGPKNAHYYEQVFAKFESGGGSLSWNWPSFFVTWFWMLYRKMYMWWLLYWFGLPILMVLVTGVIAAVVSPEMGAAFYYAGYILVAFILLPMYANKLYYNHVKGKVAKMAATTLSEEQQAQELARTGGTSGAVMVVVPIVLIALIGILAAISIPAYQDYTVRAQVAEGMSLANTAKSAVTGTYLDVGSLPIDNADAGLPDANAISGNYVSRVEIVDGAIIVSYGGDAHTAINGKTLEFQPVVGDSDALTWICGSSTIADKHLPMSCR